ncbi:MAG: hypothetical protein WB729_05655 [Candidatus Sulfotelmatobacter sp.]
MPVPKKSTPAALQPNIKHEQIEIKFVVGFDFLPNAAISQSVTVDIDDIRAAELKVDRLTPHVAVRASVPSAGPHSYRVVVMSFLPKDNPAFIPALTGNGTVDIENGTVLAVVVDGSSAVARLVKMN